MISTAHAHCKIIPSQSIKDGKCELSMYGVHKQTICSKKSVLDAFKTFFPDLIIIRNSLLVIFRNVNAGAAVSVTLHIHIAAGTNGVPT